MLAKLVREERGQGLAEYAILLGVVAIGIAAALLLMRGAVTNDHRAAIPRP